MRLFHFTRPFLTRIPAQFSFGAFALFFLISASSQAAVLSTDPIEELPSSAKTDSSTESSAKIISFQGDVKILKAETDTWQSVQENQVLGVGDKILTGKSSSADIAYDHFLLNISHLKENTKAEIRSLNPTDIYLEDGSIFSALDGLGEKGSYQIATPTAVAAVRGTHFDVGYDKANQKFTAASLPTGDASHVSKIFVTDPKDPKSEGVEVVENKQLDLNFGQPIRQNLIKPAEPTRIEAGRTVFAQMGQHVPRFQERRIEGKAQIQEMKRRDTAAAGLDSKRGKDSKPFPQKNPAELNRIPRPELSESGSETAEPHSLENVRGLEDMLAENKPQAMKPFGSFKPQRQDQLKENSPSFQGSTPSPEGKSVNQNGNQGQPQPGAMKPFGEFRPQGMNAGPKQEFGQVRAGLAPQNNRGPKQELGQAGRSGPKQELGQAMAGPGPQNNRGGPQPPQQSGGPQNNAQPQGARQGPPPPGAPKR